MRTIVITGAGGFIGRALCKYFLDKGDTVYGIDITDKNVHTLKKYRNFVPLFHEKIDLSIINRKIDIFYHIAWGGSLLPKDLNNMSLQLDNINMSIDYITKIINKGCNKVVFCGSTYQNKYYKTSKVNADMYGIAKETTSKIVEKICFENGVECNIAILTNTFGTGDKSQKAVNTFIRKMENKEDLELIEGSNKNDWVYIDDTVRGLFEVGISGVNMKRYYIGHLNIRTFKESLTEMKEILNYEHDLLFGRYHEDTYLDYSLNNAQELYDDTGFKCETTFQEAIIKTAEWIRQLDKNEVKE